MDSACSLTGAPHGAMVFLSDSLEVQNFLTSERTPEQAARLWNMADGKQFFERTCGFSKPVPLGDFQRYAPELHLPELDSTADVSSAIAPRLVTHRTKPTPLAA